jgi:hypothetical protein
MLEPLGICVKSQYEHSGPHAEIKEHGQSFPPFACVNWKPVSATVRAHTIDCPAWEGMPCECPEPGGR